MKTTLIILLVLTIASIFITGNWNYVSSVVLPNTTWGLYNKDFFELKDNLKLSIIKDYFNNDYKDLNNQLNEDLNNIIGVNGKNFLFKELDDNGKNIFIYIIKGIAQIIEDRIYKAILYSM
jgi:hypothetical protein